MQSEVGVTPTVAILALALGAAPRNAPPLPSASPPLQLVVDHERLALHLPADAVALEARPFDRQLVLKVSPARAAELARRLRSASHLCPRVASAGGVVILGCQANVRADLDGKAKQATLDLRLLSVHPWRPAEEGPPIVPFDTETLFLEQCPGDADAARGECALADGRLEDARRAFEENLREGPSPHASLRLGDLALADDRPELALEHWRKAAHTAPWGRLAAARICELEPHCMASADRPGIFDPKAVEPVLRRDMIVRVMRLRALEGDLLGVVRDVVAESGPGGACETVLPWCRHLQLLALERPLPEGAEALAAWLETPSRTEGPLAMELVRAAARQAEAAGAPAFGAKLLAAMAGRIPRAELSAHLLWTARLFLAGGDRPRAEEIVLFAETRLAPSEWAEPGWTALRRGLRRAPASRGPRPEADPPDLAAAKSAVQAARLSALRAR
jgi:tetratricopeptide (TPR) repeat protein